MTSLLIAIIAINVKGNGFNLAELKSDKIPSDPITTNIETMNLIKYASNLFKRANGVRNGKKQGEIYSIPPEPQSQFFIPRLVHTTQEQINRKKPQYIITYYAPLQSIVVFFVGTFMKSKKFDWTNAINVVPEEIELRNNNNHKIKVHGGVYTAVNTKEFYEQFLPDLQLIIDNIHKTHFSGLTADDIFKTPIKAIYFTGQSQGGSIATMLSILWQTGAACDFVDYFEDNMEEKRHIEQLMDKAQVITFGAFGIFGHGANGAEYIDNLCHDEILNLINAKDPVPMMYNGDLPAPKQGYRENDDTWIDLAEMSTHEMAQGVMDEFDEKAYYGPVGKYVVIVEKSGWFGRGKKIYFKTLDENTKNGLYDKHLVNGAKTLSRLMFGQLRILMNFKSEHMMPQYRIPITEGVDRYTKKL